MSKDDIEDALYSAGIKSNIIRSRLMYLIDLYARKFPDPAKAYTATFHDDNTGYKYLCRDCGKRKVIGEFPEYKKVNRRSPVPCNKCMEKK